jgi:hypothetical protein
MSPEPLEAAYHIPDRGPGAATYESLGGLLLTVLFFLAAGYLVSGCSAGWLTDPSLPARPSAPSRTTEGLNLGLPRGQNFLSFSDANGLKAVVAGDGALTFTRTPEPASITLLVSGFLAAGGFHLVRRGTASCSSLVC